MAHFEIQPRSTPCVKQELDLFTLPPTQCSITDTYDVPYNPVSSIDNSRRYEFHIPGTTDLIDLQGIYVELKGKVVNQTGDNLTAAQHVTASQYFLHSLFNEIDVYMNGTKVTPSNSTYQYKSYLDALFWQPKEAKKTILKAAGWDTQENRTSLLDLSREFHLMGRLHVDMFEQERLLLDHVSMSIVLNRGHDFVALYNHVPAVASGSGADAVPALSTKIKISMVRLWVTKCTIYEDSLIAIHQALHKHPAIYPYTKKEVTTRTIFPGPGQLSIDSVIKGWLPNRIIVGFVTNAAFSGDRLANAFEFGNHGITSFNFAIDGQTDPRTPYQPVWQGKLYVREYLELYRVLSQDGMPPITDISFDDFATNSCFFGAILDPDRSQGPQKCHVSPKRSGVIRADVTFANPIQNSLTMIVYAEYNSNILIDHERQIRADQVLF